MSEVKRSYKLKGIEPFYIGAASATFSSDGSVMATAVLEDTIVIDRINNEVLYTFEGDSSEVTALQLSPDEDFWPFYHNLNSLECSAWKPDL